MRRDSEESGSTLLVNTIARVSEMTTRMPMFQWDWGEAIAIQGLMAASKVIDAPKYDECVTNRLSLWQQIHPDPFWPDHLGPGVALVLHHERTGDPQALDYAERLAAHMEDLPEATTGARLVRPDKPDIDHFVWVDSLYTDGPFLCELGRVTGNSARIGEGARQTEAICASLQDHSTGLFAHRYDNITGETNGVFWGRGCGWAALGLGHTLSLMPPTHPLWPKLVDRIEGFAETAEKLQDSSGHWHAVIDRSSTRLESSTTALIAEGLALAIDAGALGEPYRATVVRAWSAIAEETDSSGRATNVSQRSPSSSSWEDYARLPHGGLYTWGQGPWLLLSSRFAGGPWQAMHDLESESS